MIKNLAVKEKIASLVWLVFALIILLSGIYDFIIVANQPLEMLKSCGVFVLLLSFALQPKILFIPLKESWKGNVDGLVNIKIINSMYFVGIFIFLLALVLE
ncbi:hypothetical protein N483_07740 [Pseudoalteromonas luteoviolacea NCIMB 1944]|uniref:Uncharacterized protein n=1 Tax=Pseudoalteromonas luteoviolacea (strain 2ta16) TaxID=1353533 RepID=V4HN02_PSEL2|nr:hypothetical protein PL2TA16_05047 [Pseudoalteromonas luteoviolacea 2ta16]KZN29318.1 hypothetical protein N483_07740 [Pseudoalteromonas luteoviolacea NCIMB 1944]